MADSTKELLIQWLAQGNSQHRALLQQCQISVSSGLLVIDCPQNIWEQLLDYSQALGWLATGDLVKEVQLNLEGQIEHKFKPEHAHQYTAAAPIDVFGLQISNQLQIGRGNAIAVVEMGTNFGVFCTRKINEISRLPDDRWRDQDMRVYHLPEEYQRFMDALSLHERITDFEYHALTGDYQKYWQRVNAYLGRLGDRAVRVVEVLDYKLL